MADFIPDFPESLPANIRTALDGILNHPYSSSVRQDIVDALNWEIENARLAAEFINALGLVVQDGKLCYTNADVLEGYGSIPSKISSALERILTGVYGPELRNDIVTVLRYGADHTSKIAEYISDFGLTVVDGKLCVIFYPEE